MAVNSSLGVVADLIVGLEANNRWVLVGFYPRVLGFYEWEIEEDFSV